MNRAQLVDAVVRVDALMVDGGGDADEMRERIADVDPVALADQVSRRMRARGLNADSARQQGAELAAECLTTLAEQPAPEPEPVRPSWTAGRTPAPRNPCTCDHLQRAHKPNQGRRGGPCTVCGCQRFEPAPAVAAVA